MKRLLLLAVLNALPPAAQAAGIGTCTITVDSAGTLTPDPLLTTLDTRNAGGAPARIRVSTSFGGAAPALLCAIGLPLNCGQVSITPPSSFSSTPSDAGSVTTEAVLTLETGTAPILLRLNGQSVILLNGTYTFRVDLNARKSSGMFGRGTHRAVQTVTCN